MFDIGFWEMSVIALIALVVLGPERLPGVARTVGLWVGRARRMISDVKADIDREIRNADIKELEEIKKGISDTGKEVSSAMSKASEAPAKLKEDLDVSSAIREGAESITKPTTPTSDQNSDIKADAEKKD